MAIESPRSCAGIVQPNWMAGEVDERGPGPAVLACLGPPTSAVVCRRRRDGRKAARRDLVSGCRGLGRETLDARAERAMEAAGGYVLVFGWAADDGGGGGLGGRLQGSVP